MLGAKPYTSSAIASGEASVKSSDVIASRSGLIEPTYDKLKSHSGDRLHMGILPLAGSEWNASLLASPVSGVRPSN